MFKHVEFDLLCDCTLLFWSWTLCTKTASLNYPSSEKNGFKEKNNICILQSNKKVRLYFSYILVVKCA